MLQVHHLGRSQSERIPWLCEELGLPYDLVCYDRDPATGLAPAEYKALHPAGTAPVIRDGELVLAESGAIIDYIVGRYGDGRLRIAADQPDFAQFLYWYHFSNGSLMPAFMTIMDGGRLAPIMQARADRGLASLDDHLSTARWLAGDAFTVADIMIVFPLTTMRAHLAIDLAPYPNILAYLQRIGERPAFRRAMAKGDPGMAPRLT